ncbi:ribonuclease T2 family protein [Pseudomonas sp. zfem002]|uniref:ribonuclease T2 family protein n=1 Tax=Pseudomonas sp. zfem002 TaxID=3078197 RepID=UPI002929457B|nr:ribonuclease T(2) [Pseudomonas sp. zfem002]MDU9393473.1 ribonuclease T(2) [Pseudomonas sp. zfem002]
MGRLAAFSLAGAIALLNIDTTLAADASAGTFTLTQRCEAFQSFKNQTNPGERSVQPGQTLRIVEVNRERYQWVRVDLGGKDLRWVSAACGRVEGLQIAETGTQACRIPDQYDSHVLAVTWQPGFCERDKGGPAKPECQAMKEGELKVDHFTLHGLWPNKQACGIDYGKCAGPELDLSEATVEYIRPWMPNFNYGTQFGNHEWKKHGVCQTALSDDEYFRLAVDLVKSFNDSSAGAYVRGNAGGEMSKAQFYSKLTDDFGNQAVQNNVQLICSGDYLKEVRVALPKDFQGERSLKGAIGQAFLSARGSDRNECRDDRIRIEASGPGA